MEYYSAIKINTFESVLMRWMNLESIIQSEVSQKEKDKYCILTHMCFPCGSAGKEFACNARDLGSIPGLGRSPGGGKGYHFKRASLVAQTVKVSACNVGDLGSISGWGRPTGEGNGNPFQYSCLENLMD